MVVEVVERARRAEPLDVFRRCVGVETHRKELALDQVGLRRQAQADRHVRLAHREVELLIGGDQREVDVGIELDELAQPRGEPMHADAGRRRDPQVAVRSLAAVGQLGARGLELHEHVVGGVMEELALFGKNKSARVSMEKRDPEFLFERRYLSRYRRLRQTELFARVGEAAGLGSGVEYFEFVPVHDRFGVQQALHSAATAGSASPCAARKRSASSAAMQPWPAAVTAWR